jgi:hypothetical protein
VVIHLVSGGFEKCFHESGFNDEESHVSWWWCLNHSRAEQDPNVDAGAADKLGPYETEEAANNWRQQFEERNEQWDKWDEEDKEGRKKS